MAYPHTISGIASNASVVEVHISQIRLFLPAGVEPAARQTLYQLGAPARIIAVLNDCIMRYQNVCVESLAYTLPDEVVTSAEIEARLAPLYQRLRLPEGRLELMSGHRHATLLAAGHARPASKSVETAEKASQAAGIDRRHIGALVHGSVCRDFLEPATACGVHHRLGLPARCTVYDVSNACLGLLSGMLQVANMIELGQIRAGVVVGHRKQPRRWSSRPFATSTPTRALSRNDIKPAFASLTIGSGSAAVLLVDRRLSRQAIGCWAARSVPHTDQRHLCQGGSRRRRPRAARTLLMSTDSEALLREGVAAAKETFAELLRARTGSASKSTRPFATRWAGPIASCCWKRWVSTRRSTFTTFEYAGQYRLGRLADDRGPGHRAGPRPARATAWRCWASARASTSSCSGSTGSRAAVDHQGHKVQENRHSCLFTVCHCWLVQQCLTAAKANTAGRASSGTQRDKELASDC